MSASELQERPDEEPLDYSDEDFEALPSVDELKSILQHITTLISDADRRHAQALGELQHRLETLGQEARSVRQQVPEEYQPAFERIEDGLDQIATRISRSETERKAAKAEATAATPHRDDDAEADALAGAGPAPSPDLHMHPTGDDASPASHYAEPAEAAPAPLRSALLSAPGSNTPALRGSMRPEAGWPHAHQTSSVDPFDLVESTRPGDADDPWDERSANDLSRTYEDLGLLPKPVLAEPQATTPAPTYAAAAPLPSVAGAAAFAAMSALPAMSAEPARMPAEPQASPAAAPAPMFDIGRDWLEARFAEIASRVEQSLAGLRNDTPAVDLDSKLDQLESRFGMVLEGVATRSDIENLREVETHLDSLAAHVEQAQLQLQRLDTIEAQLNAVMEKLSDQRLSAILEQSGQGQHVDAEQIANAAAEQVAQRLAGIAPSASASTSDGERLDELREMLNAFILERRQGEEQTAGMLDTMQQAMIRLLDRVDALEFSPDPHEAEYQDHAAEHAASEAAPAVAAAQEPAPQRAEEEPQPAVKPKRAVPSLDVDAAGIPVAAVQTPATAASEAKAEIASTDPQSAAGDARPQVKPGEVTREQLIAEARRAMQLAAAKREAEAQQQAEEQAKKGGAKSRVEGMVGGLSKSTRRIMVGACTLLLLSSAVLLLMPRKPAGTIPEPKTSQAKTPAKADAPAAPAKAEVAPVAPSPAPAPVTDPRAAKNAGTAPAEAPKIAAPQTVPPAFLPKHMPETAIDELSSPAPEPQDRAVVQEATLPQAAFPGITLHHNPEIGPQEAAKLRERQRMAELNARVGAAQIGAQQARTVRVSGDTVAVPAPAPGRAGEGEAASRGSAPVEMPPLAIGPTSLRQAAAKGDPSAEFEVAARFAEGRGVQQDFQQAMRWYQRSAAQGFVQAQYRLGTLYERGLGVKADTARARVWYQRAAEAGNVKAMHNLAVLSAGRDAANPDYATVAKWFRAAAEHGLADSQFNLAVLHESGLGVARDVPQSYKWLSIASRSGDKEAARRLAQVRNKLSNAEIQAAEIAVQAFETKPVDRLVNDPIMAGEVWKARSQPEAAS